MQFTRGTFAAMVKEYGDRIPGMEKYAEGLRNGSVKANDAGLQAMRYDQKVAGYAAGGIQDAGVFADQAVSGEDVECCAAKVYAAGDVGKRSDLHQIDRARLKGEIAVDGQRRALRAVAGRKRAAGIDLRRADRAGAGQHAASIDGRIRERTDDVEHAAIDRRASE